MPFKPARLHCRRWKDVSCERVRSRGAVKKPGGRASWRAVALARSLTRGSLAKPHPPDLARFFFHSSWGEEGKKLRWRLLGGRGRGRNESWSGLKTSRLPGRSGNSSCRRQWAVALECGSLLRLFYRALTLYGDNHRFTYQRRRWWPGRCCNGRGHRVRAEDGGSMVQPCGVHGLQPSIGGSAGRNTLTGPFAYNFDRTIVKRFPIGEGRIDPLRSKLSLRRTGKIAKAPACHRKAPSGQI